MKQTSASGRIASFGLTCVLLWSAGMAAASAQTVAPPEAPATLKPSISTLSGKRTWVRRSRSTPAGWRRRRPGTQRSAVMLI
jgi:hypothetical protein